MGHAEELQAALRETERALGKTIERYRTALVSCAECGRLFSIGDLVVVMADSTGRLCLEHRVCPDEDEPDQCNLPRITNRIVELDPTGYIWDEP